MAFWSIALLSFVVVLVTHAAAVLLPRFLRAYRALLCVAQAESAFWRKRGADEGPKLCNGRYCDPERLRA